ncbi:MAG: hypothetical protein PHW69_06480 [Elusimicrobiaceae bacterium]|nr:hypothetical protein [Elusimicrobiaceae bacterium]
MRKFISLWLSTALVFLSASEPALIYAQGVANRQEIAQQASPVKVSPVTDLGFCGLNKANGILFTKSGKKLRPLEETVSRKLLDVISSGPQDQAETTLAKALLSHLQDKKAASKYASKTPDGLKLTRNGCKALAVLARSTETRKADNDDKSAAKTDVHAATATARNVAGGAKAGASASTGTVKSVLPPKGVALSGKNASALANLANAKISADQFFDGSAQKSGAEPAVAAAESGAARLSAKDLRRQQKQQRQALKQQQKQERQTLKQQQKQQLQEQKEYESQETKWNPLVGKPPADNWKGRLARTLGALGAGAGIGAISGLLWGPAAAAYHVSSSIIKSLDFNKDSLGKAKPVIGYIAKHSTGLRIGAGVSMLLGGVVLGNPLVTYFGLTFATLGAGEKLGKVAYDAAYKVLGKPIARMEAKRLARQAEKQQAAAADPAASQPDPEKEQSSKSSNFFSRLGKTISENRGEIARIGIASLLSTGLMVGAAVGTNALLGNVTGKMASGEEALSFGDRARNTVIGAYRYYTISGSAMNAGKNTNAFYAEMKTKYNPVTPDDWAAVIEKEITWIAHPELYGTPIYYISSEEAAAISTYKGIVGRYSDCSGKAVLLRNMLKMDGLGSSDFVLGLPKIGGTDTMNDAHCWLTRKDADGNVVELFHYDNTKNLVYSMVQKDSEGLIKGQRMPEFASGGIGQILSNVIYKGLNIGSGSGKKAAQNNAAVPDPASAG